MKLYFKLIVLLFSASISAAELLITADEVSNTLSFVDASTMSTLAYKPLGPPRKWALSSSLKTYVQNNVHGVTISPDKKFMAVTSNISNSVVIYETGDLSAGKNFFYVGLSPHVALFTPDSKELWVATRGTNYIEIIDMKTRRTMTRLPSLPCPSFFAFDAKKTLAYVSYTCAPQIQAYNYKTKKLISSVNLNGQFSPLLTLSPDQKELWVIRKDTGEVARISTEKMEVVEYIKTGDYPQHVIFSKKNDKTMAIVSVGAEPSIKTYLFDSGTKIPAVLDSQLIIPGLPHGLALNAPKNIAYVATEHGDKVYSVDLNTMKITGSAKVGNSPQSLIYVKELDLKDYKKHMKGFSETETTFAYELNSDQIKNTAAVSARLFPGEVTMHLKIHGWVPEEKRFRFYISKSAKDLTKIKENDSLMIGILICDSKIVFSCLSTTSLPQSESLLNLLKDPNAKVYGTDEEGTIIFRPSKETI